MSSTTTRNKIGAADIKWWDGISNTFTRETSTGGLLTLNKIGTMVDVAEAFGGGSISETALTTSIANIGTTNDRTILLRPGTWYITGNLTIPANITIHIAPGAVINIATTKTLTINGHISAGPYQIFSWDGTGAIILSNQIVYPQWWGVDDTGTTAVNTELQKCIDSLTSGGVILITGTLLFDDSDPVELDDDITIQGAGGIITAAACTNTICFTNKGSDLDYTNGLPTTGGTTWKDSDYQNKNITLKDLKITGKMYSFATFINAKNIKIQNLSVDATTGSSESDTIRSIVTFTGAIDGALVENIDAYSAGAVWIATSNRDAGDYPLSAANREYQACKHITIRNIKWKAHTGGSNECILVGSYGGDTYDITVDNLSIYSGVDQSGVWGTSVFLDSSIPDNQIDNSYIYQVRINNVYYNVDITTKTNTATAIMIYDQSSTGYQITDIIVDGIQASGTTINAIYVESAERVKLLNIDIRDGQSNGIAAYPIRCWTSKKVTIKNVSIKNYLHGTATAYTSGAIQINGEDYYIDNINIDTCYNNNAGDPDDYGLYIATVDKAVINNFNIVNSAVTGGIYFGWDEDNIDCNVNGGIIDGAVIGIRVTGAFNCRISNMHINNSTTYGLDWQNDVAEVAGVIVDNNYFDTNADEVNSWPTADIISIKRNIGVVTENGGTSAQIATGATIAHGLATTPTVISVTAAESGPTDLYATADATDITVNFGGGGNKAFNWYAIVNP